MTDEKEKVRLGWHFLSKDKRLSYADKRRVRRNTWFTMKPAPRPWLDSYGNVSYTVSTSPHLCHSGMHASSSIRDALLHASQSMSILCRVKVQGTICCSADKFCGRRRIITSMGDVEKELLGFARKAILEYCNKGPVRKRDKPMYRRAINDKFDDPYSVEDFSLEDMPLDLFEALAPSRYNNGPVCIAIYALGQISVSEKAIEARLQRAVKGCLT